jgi:hypothetical protein
VEYGKCKISALPRFLMTQATQVNCLNRWVSQAILIVMRLLVIAAHRGSLNLRPGSNLSSMIVTSQASPPPLPLELTPHRTLCPSVQAVKFK